MSPVATRSTTVLNNGGHNMNGMNGKLNGHARGGGRGGGNSVMPHITDLTQVPTDVNTAQAMETLLGAAERSVKSAETMKGLSRQDIALKEYMRSYSIAVEVIPRHRDWVTIQNDRIKLGERYNKLLKRIKDNGDDFQRIKADIKADNARTGVQPTAAANAARPPNDLANRAVNGHGSPQQTASPGKGKPPVKPKPPNLLHGNAIQPGTSAPGQSAHDPLAARFANIRKIPSAPVQQDPRIRTQPIPHARPAGPRDMPSHPQRPIMSLDSDLPLPKFPAAIYSPPRGTVSSEAADLPSSTPGMYSRANSITIQSNASMTNLANSSSTSFQKLLPSDGYFAPGPARPTKRKPALPLGNDITVDDLLRYQQYGHSDFPILLIDVRDRKDFDEGHIMWPATICVEPEILKRESVSAENIADFIVLSPDVEKNHFDKRHEFDLVVFYDQDTEDFTSSKALHNLFYALQEFDFPEEDSASKHPKLLKGGLEAWANVMGRNSLQTSSTFEGVGMKSKPRRRFGAPSQSKPKPRYTSRSIQNPEEARRWEQHLAPQEEVETSDQDKDFEVEFARSTEDVLRRFPAAENVQESMVSPISRDNPNSRIASRLPADIYSSIPSPPARPAPARPKHSHSGLDNLDDMVRTKRIIGPTATRKRAAGLDNPGNWCYSNSSLQSLYNSSGFADEIASGDWREMYRAPKKASENIPPPQLMTKMLQNVFDWMGKLDKMKAKTLMEYCAHITDKSRIRFGGPDQQDAQEFLNFLMEQVHDETNIYRHLPSDVEQPRVRKDRTIYQDALEYWTNHSKANASIITKYWRGLEVKIVQCECGYETRNFAPIDILMPKISLDLDRGEKTTLQAMLNSYYDWESAAEWTCDSCKQRGKALQRLQLARLPDLLCVIFSRNQWTARGQQWKIDTPVEFPVRNLDMRPYFIEEDATVAADHHFTNPFTYDAYAVMQHRGNTVNSGHYIAAMKDAVVGGSSNPADSSLWHTANDTRVDALQVGSGPGDPGVQKLVGVDNFQAYIVFFQRTSAGLR